MLQIEKKVLKTPPTHTATVTPFLNSGVNFLEKIPKEKPNGKLDCKVVTNNEKDVESSKVYICKYCCYKFSSSGSLLSHIAGHGVNPKHICYVCGSITNTFSALMVHFLKHSNSHNYDEVPHIDIKVSSNNSKEIVSSSECLKCRVCKVSFENMGELQSHDCRLMCREKLVSKAELVSSCLVTEKEPSHDQPYVVKSVFSKSSLLLSEETKINKQIDCYTKNDKSIEKGNTNSLSKDVLLATRKSVRLGKRKRRVFSETFTRHIENYTHADHQYTQEQQSMVKYDQQELFCNVCSMSFINRKNLLRHQQMHTEKPSFMCKYCGKFFHRKDIHNRHEKTVHRLKICKMFCFYCKASFSSPSALKDHVMSVHGESEMKPLRMNPCHSVKRKAKPLKFMNMQHPVSSKVYTSTYQNVDSAFSEPKENDIVTTSIRKNDQSFSSSVKEKISTDEPDHGNSMSMNFKCGKCLKPFNSLPCLLKHFQSVHDVSFSSTAACADAENSQSFTEACEINHPVVQSLHSSTSSNTQLENHESMHVNSSTDSNGRNLPNVSPSNCSEHSVSNACAFPSLNFHNYSLCNDLLNSATKNAFSKVPKEDQETTESSFGKSIENVLPSPFNKTCSLCLQNFSCQSAFLSHERQHMHKMVHWYRCAICNTCGPKKNVAQHMLSHMQMVGSFVVNGNEQNFENILPYLSTKEKTTMSESVPASETGIS